MRNTANHQPFCAPDPISRCLRTGLEKTVRLIFSWVWPWRLATMCDPIAVDGSSTHHEEPLVCCAPACGVHLSRRSVPWCPLDRRTLYTKREATAAATRSWCSAGQAREKRFGSADCSMPFVCPQRLSADAFRPARRTNRLRMLTCSVVSRHRMTRADGSRQRSQGSRENRGRFQQRMPSSMKWTSLCRAKPFVRLIGG